MFALIFVPTILLVCMQKDLGTAFIITAIFISMFFTSNFLLTDKLKSVFLGATTCLILFFGLTLFKENLLTDAQSSRFNFFNPCKNYSTSGYQICNAFIAINKGGAFGVGIGKVLKNILIFLSHIQIWYFQLYRKKMVLLVEL